MASRLVFALGERVFLERLRRHDDDFVRAMPAARKAFMPRSAESRTGEKTVDGVGGRHVRLRLLPRRSQHRIVLGLLVLART